MTTRTLALLSLPLAALFAISSVAIGQSTWDGSEPDDNWFTADNWDTGIIPNGAADQAIVGVPSPTFANGSVLLQSLNVTADGVLTTAVSSNFNFAPGATVSLTNAGDITLGNNSDFQLLGMANNSGTINVASTGNATDLEIALGGATLTGGGTVTLSGPFAGINDATGTQILTIVDQTIQGVGNVGRNTTDFNNQAGGLLLANVNGQTLVLDSATVFTNAGTLRASDGGILALNEPGAGNYLNTGGIIEALADSQVLLNSGAHIVGGTLSTTGNGSIVSAVSSNIELENLTLNGNFTAGNNSDAQIRGTINNTGNINIASTGNATDLEVGVGGATLTGGGKVILSGTFAGINDASGTQTLTIVDQTIEGRGEIGRNTTDFNLQAGNVIDANVNGQFLALDSATVFTNAGTLRASDGGVLLLRDAGPGNYANAGGTIEALADSEVRLASGAHIIGGTVTSVGTGFVTTDVSSNTELEDLTLSAEFTAGNNSDVRITGTINNTGNINIASTGNQTDLEVALGGAMLTGGGKVILSGPFAGINDATGTQTLTVVDQTIEGRGEIGRNTTDFTVQAGNLIDANVNGQALALDPANIFTNAGTLRASGGGILLLRDGGVGDFANAGGTIEALAGSEVQLISGARVAGGLLRSVGTGVVTSAVSSNTELEALTFEGEFIAGNNSDTRITGVINNTGTINIASTGNQTDLEVAVGGATLTGGGTVVLSGPFAGINDASGTQTLTIGDQTIEGRGNIGQNTLNIVNTAAGTILANVPGSPLVVDVAAPDWFNDGTLAVDDTKLNVVGNLIGSATAVLTGNGFIDTSANATIDHAGLISPGFSPGMLTLGTTAVTLQSTAEIAIEIGGTIAGTTHDLLAITSTLALDGELSLSLFGGFLPSFTDTFEVITTRDGLTGAFANVANGGTLFTEDGLASFTVHYGAGSLFDPNNVVLTNFIGIPEPATGVLLLLSTLTLFTRRRNA